MESQVFKDGNFVYECKTSPSYLGGAIEVLYLKFAISQVKQRWAKSGFPSGYYYVFPVNYVSNDARRVLEEFKSEYRGQVDIDYYDCDQVKNLLQAVAKINSLQSLVDYIEKVRKK
jgi:hypothetical protein